MNSKNIEDSLKNLIEQTYQIEQEYKNLSLSYQNLQKIVKDVVDVLPTAIWVLNSDNTMFLQNAQALKSKGLFKMLNLNKTEYECELGGLFYLIKISSKDNKKIIQAIDITNQKRTERLASMGQVAAHLAHEIRNPVGSISLLSSTLLKRVDDNNKLIVNEIQSAIFRLERIIKATLLFTKGVQINRINFDFITLKHECFEALKFYGYSKDIQIDLNFPNISYNADFALLCMVFENLIFNAIDAIEESDEESGNIRLEYEKTKNEHKFYLYDSGVSIADSRMVFEPFKTSKLNGNGLGLSLCLQIIAAHKGSIEVILNPKCFCVSLPC